MAGDIAVSSPPSLRSVMSELAPRFERASGHTLTLGWELMPAMARKIEAGAAFDVAILTPELMDAAIASGRIGASGQTAFARTGLGVAFRRGAARPDVSTVAAFTTTLLAAGSIGYTADGAAGIAFLAMINRIGVSSVLQTRLKPMPGGGTVLPVAHGEVEISVTTIPGILEVSGAELAGPLPAELQSWVVYTAGVSTAARDRFAAATLIAFLTSPDAVAVMRSKGVEPIGR